MSYRVLITNQRMPYYIEVERRWREGDRFCVVKLTRGFWRILHVRTGITMSDTNSFAAADRFIVTLNEAMKNYPEMRDFLDSLTWRRYCKYKNGGKDGQCKKLDTFFSKLADKPGHVSKNETKHAKFFYSPEFIK